MVTERAPAAEATSEVPAPPSGDDLAAALLQEGADADRKAQEGQVAEAPTEGAAPPPPAAPEPEPTPPPPPQRLQDTQEWRQFQAAKDREVAFERRQRQEAEARAAQRDMEVEVEAFRRNERDKLIQQNTDPQLAEAIANASASERRARLQTESQARQTQMAAAERYVQSERAAALSLARIFKTDYGLTDADVEVLMDQVTPEAILSGSIHASKFDKMARHISDIRKQSQPKSTVKPGQIVGAGTTQPVSRPTEAEMFRRYREGDKSPEVRRYMDGYMNQGSY